MLEYEALLMGTTLSQEIRALLLEALRVRYKHRSLAKNIAAYDLQQLAKEANLSIERLSELACEADAPSFTELVKLAKVMPLDADELTKTSKLKPRKSEEAESTQYVLNT